MTPVKKSVPILFWATLAFGSASAGEFPVVRHANQAEQPFLFVGQVMDESQPRWGEYRDAIERFPDLDSCFFEPHGGTIKPAKFDWAAMKGHGFEVCLFRIAASLGTAESMSGFVQSLGFNKPSLNRAASATNSNLRNQFNKDFNVILKSSWPIEEKEFPLRHTFVDKLVDSVFSPSFFIEVVYGIDGDILNVSYGVTTE